MSSYGHHNAPAKTQKRDRKEKTSKHVQEDFTNKENVLTDLSAHFALHAERMKLLKRAEEGLEKLSLDPLVGATHDTKKGQERLSSTQTIEVKHQDGNTKRSEKKSSRLPLPASTARQRRREKQESGKSKIQIKDYKPGYTWNRGGRVKELRIRCLARKFSQIWKKNTFGRVMPSKARHHYNTHIMKMVFSEWYDMWWHVRKEWRLMVRAECHFRYLAWTKYFEAWKEFVVFMKQKNKRSALAAGYDGNKVLRRAFSVWKDFISQKKEQTKKRESATEFYENCLLKKCWVIWKEKYDAKQDRKNMGVVALQFWAYRLQLQHWMIWCEAFKRRHALYSKERLAYRHHKFYTMQRALNAWMEYWSMKRKKKAKKEYAESIHHRCVLVRCMRVWVNQYNTRMLIYNQQAQIQDLAERFTKRRYFYKMLQYVEIQQEKHEKEKLAEVHYMRKLKVIGITAFRLYLVKQRTKEMQQQMATDFYINMLTRRHWNRWMSRCEDNEELAIHCLTVRALQHYKQVVCRKMVDAWLDYIEWRKHRQAQYDRADAFYYVRAMPVFLRHIKGHAELQKRNREYAEMAVEFRRENLAARFFYMWYNNFEQSREDRMNKRMAILHYESCTFKRFFAVWRNRYHQAIVDHRKEVEAVHYFNTVLCRRHLRAWKVYVEELRIGEINNAEATKHYYKHQLSRSLKVWKQFMLYKRNQRQKKNIAIVFYRRHVCHRVMKVLRNNVVQGRQFREIADTQYGAKCQQLLRSTLWKWKENCEKQKEDRQTENLAVCHYHRKILGKVTSSWHRYAVIHAYKKSERNRWVENTQKVLNYNKLQRYFSYWKKQRDESLLNRLKSEQAIQHYNRVVLQNLISRWKQYVQICIKEKLLNKQCIWFNEVRLKTWSVLVWKQEHVKAQETARRSALALWHWSLSLQKQMLVAWYIYTQDRKRKKSRINHALERRRTRLIRNGVTQWLSVADDLSSLRAKFAAQQHASKAFTMHQIVQKCALHWRQWAGRRKAKRASDAHAHGAYKVQQKVDFMVPSHQTKMLRPEPIISAGPDYGPRPTAIGLSYVVDEGLKSLPCDSTVLHHGPRSVPSGPSSMQNFPARPNVVSPVSPRSVIEDIGSSKLLPQVSASPVRSKGIVPESVPSKHVGFKLDRNIPSRRKPRHPSFLADSLKKAGLFSCEQETFEPEETIDHERVPKGHYGEGDLPVPLNIPEESPTDVTDLNQPKILSNTFTIDSNKEEQLSELGRVDNLTSDSENNGMRSTFQVRGFIEKPTVIDKGASDVENVTHPSEKSLSSITSDVKSDNTFTVPKKGYKTFENKLMTPADFMGTKMTSTLTKDAVKELPHVGLSPRDRIDGYSSINSTLKSKETMDLLSSANDSAKLKISSGFSTGNYSSKFKESGGFLKSADDTTPRSADSYLPINFDTPRAGTALASQITDIRNRLKGFNDKKKRLRKLQKQHVHLSDWLDKEVKQGEEVDIDVIKTEITGIEEDMRKLNQEIDVEKPMCAKLVSEVQVLVKLLQGSEMS